MKLADVFVLLVVAIAFERIVAFLSRRAEIQKRLDRLYCGPHEDVSFERLKSLGNRAEGALVRALDEPKTREIRFPGGLGAGSPFERISALLVQIGSAKAAEGLGRYLNHDDAYFRKQAALALGSIGAIECISPILKALEDHDDDVRSYAMIGIHRGIDAGRSEQRFLAAVVPALTNLLDRSDSTSGDPPRLLLKIDAAHAIPTLLSTKYFSIENIQVQHLISALNEAGHAIPHEVLLPFLEAVRPRIGEYPFDCAYAAALIAYGKNPDSATEDLLNQEIQSSSAVVQESAAVALALLAGVDDAGKNISHCWQTRGFSALNDHQKNYLAVLIYDADVCDGGHSQYFGNSGGTWRHVLEGLAAIGAVERAKILREATELFGAEGPSEEEETRGEQLAAFGSKEEATFDDLDQRYYACKENVTTLLTLYAIKHKDFFCSNAEASQ